MLEGAFYGVAFSLMFTVAVTAITRARCPYGLAARTLLSIAGVALACWVVGGLLGMTLATISPEMYRQTFIPRPGSPGTSAVLSDTGALLAYAWVGGSIWGGLIGGLAAVVVALTWFHHHWRQLQDRAATTDN